MGVRRDFTAREIAEMSIEEVRALPEGGLNLTFDDGSKTKAKTYKTWFASFYWRFCIAHGGSLTQAMSMCRTDKDGHYMEDVYTTSTQAVISEEAFWNAFWSGEQCPKRFWLMSEDMYMVNNLLYNDTTSNDLKWMSTYSLEDSMQVIMHPEIVATKKKWLDGLITLEDCHDTCYKIVETDTEYFKDNDIHKMVRCGLLSKTQVKQLIGPRGNVPDINSEAQPHVIEAGFYERLNYGYDSAVEARSASVALYMQGGPLEDSEYNNRMCGLHTGVIRGVHYGDCGTKQNIQWHVTTNSHLRAIKGKNIILDDGNLMRIKGDEKGLIGQTVKIRSVTACEHHERGVICSTCLGQNAFVVPPGAAPGPVLVIDPLGQISQTILSTKHVLSNVIALELAIKGDGAHFLEKDKDSKYLIKFRQRNDFSKLRMRIPHDQVQFLSDLDHVEDMSKINVTAISDVKDIIMTKYEKGVPASYTAIDTEVSGVGACLTKHFLQYVKEKGWSIVNEYVEIDISDWNPDVPFMVTKRVSQDVTVTLKAFKNFISPRKDVRKQEGVPITRCESADEALRELFDVLSPKITTNLSQIEMFVYACMARENDWQLPKGNEPFRFVRMEDALINRSAMVSLGFQYQTAYVFNHRNYIKDPASVPSHPMDGLLATGMV